MRWPRFTIQQLLLAATLVALLLGLFTAVWRMETPELIEHLSFSPSGKYLAVRYSRGTVHVWRLDQGRPRLVVRAFGEPVPPQGHYEHGPLFEMLDWTFFLSEERLLKAEWDPLNSRLLVRNLDIATGKVTEVMQIPSKSEPHYGVSASADSLFVVNEQREAILCYDLATQQLKRQITIPPPSWYFQRLTRSVDGQTLAARDEDRKLHVIDAATGQIIRTTEQQQSEIFETMDMSVASSQFGAPLLKTNLKYKIVWVATARDGQILAVADQFEAVEFYDATTKMLLRRIAYDEMHRASTSGRIALSLGSQWPDPTAGYFGLTPDGKIFAAPDWNRVQLWEIATGKLQYTIGGSHSRRLQIVAFIIGFALWAAAWGIVNKRERNRATAAIAANPLPAIAPVAPLELKVCWGLFVIGGLVALAIPISLIFWSGSMQLCCPMPYGLFVGLAAISRGSSRDTLGLKTTATFQALNLIACDPINPLLAALELILLERPRVQQYLQQANSLQSCK